MLTFQINLLRDLTLRLLLLSLLYCILYTYLPLNKLDSFKIFGTYRINYQMQVHCTVKIFFIIVSHYSSNL